MYGQELLMTGRKAARNVYSSNTNKIGIQCVCWFYSQEICYDAWSYDRKIQPHGTSITVILLQVGTHHLSAWIPSPSYWFCGEEWKNCIQIYQLSISSYTVCNSTQDTRNMPSQMHLKWQFYCVLIKLLKWQRVKGRDYILQSTLC